MSERQESAEKIALTPSEHFRVIEDRRRAAEGVLWQLPGISLAAQAFLLNAGLGSDAESSTQAIVGALGIGAVLGTGLIILYQATRASIFVNWIDRTVSQPLSPDRLATETLDYGPGRLRRVNWAFRAFYGVCFVALLAFLVADGYVFGRGAGWW